MPVRLVTTASEFGRAGNLNILHTEVQNARLSCYRTLRLPLVRAGQMLSIARPTKIHAPWTSSLDAGKDWRRYA